MILRTLMIFACLVSIAPLAACAPIEGPNAKERTAIEVLQHVSALATSRELLVGPLSRSGLPADWLTSEEACVVAEIVRQPVNAAIVSLRATVASGSAVVLAGEVNLEICGPVRKGALSTGAQLVLAGAVDVVQGSLLLDRVHERDPHGYGVGCGVLELVRDLGVEGLREGSVFADRRLPWRTQALQAAACREAVTMRTLALGSHE